MVVVVVVACVRASLGPLFGLWLGGLQLVLESTPWCAVLVLVPPRRAPAPLRKVESGAAAGTVHGCVVCLHVIRLGVGLVWQVRAERNCT